MYNGMMYGWFYPIGCGTPACGTPACGTPQLLPGDIKEGEALVAVWEYQLVSYLVPVQTLRKINLRALGASAEQTASDTKEETT